MSVLNNDYRTGFEEGFRAVKGSTAALPALPAQPATPAGSTPFREGIKRGIKAAGAEIVK